jgi:hypothetical protein
LITGRSFFSPGQSPLLAHALSKAKSESDPLDGDRMTRAANSMSTQICQL